MTSDAARDAAPIRPAPPHRPEAPRPGPDARRGMTALMCGCVVLVVAMVAAINLSLPALSAGALAPSSTELLWIVDSYVLVFGCLLIPAGALGDRYGRKGVLLAGLGVFAAGCLLSAAATGVPVLLAGRLVGGAGAALIMPASLSLLVQATPPAGRARAVAAWTAATGVAGAVGNIAGGAVLQWLPWQALFLAGAPVALVLALLAARFAPRGERHPAALDAPGVVLLTVALFALLFAVIEGPVRGWTSAPVLGGFACAAVLVPAFAAHALRTGDPVLDPRLFAIAPVRGGVLGIGLAFFGLFALFFVNAQYLQYAKGYSPLLTGVAIAPLVVGMVVMSRRSVGLTERFGTRPMAASGLFAIAGALVLLSFADASTPYVLYALVLVLMSLGMGACVPPLSILVMASLPPARAGLGSGLNGAAREIGSALGVAVLGTVLTGRLADGLPGSGGGGARSVGEALGAVDAAGGGAAAHARVIEAFTGGLSAGYRVVAVVVCVLAVLAVRGLPGRRRGGDGRRPGHSTTRAERVRHE
ncbi:MFS transporter [Spirillospora sp. NPDC052242]